MCKCSCECSNLLTIADYGSKCRQCVLGSHAAVYGIALVAADLTAKNGGGTFTRDRLEATTTNEGYAVGLANGSAVLVPAGDRHALARAICVVRQTYPKATHVGTWTSDDLVAVDPVRIVADLASAMALARENGQEAIYDFAERRDLIVPFESVWAQRWDAHYATEQDAVIPETEMRLLFGDK
jgi:hypothetical protein